MALTPEEIENKLTLWKPQAEEIRVHLTSNQSNSSEGRVYFKIWSSQEKLKRAGKTLGLLWGLAILSIAIPIAHFVLVPAFLIAGPIASMVVLNREDVILGGVAICPDCKSTFDIVKSKPDWPLKDICSHCRHEVLIQKTQG